MNDLLFVPINYLLRFNRSQSNQSVWNSYGSLLGHDQMIDQMTKHFTIKGFEKFNLQMFYELKEKKSRVAQFLLNWLN